MEPKFTLETNGQELQRDDLNTLGETAAYGTDRLLADLLRILPYTGTSVAKAIIPYTNGTDARSTTVESGSTAGTVRINPFRAVIGTRTAASADARKAWQDITTAVYTGTGALATQLAVTPNASADPRWDLIYATVSVETATKVATRRVRSSGNLTTPQLTILRNNTVTIGTLAGVPAASPVLPTLGADSAGNYYIPLAYIRVRGNYAAAELIPGTSIIDAQTVASIQEGLAHPGFEPADSQYRPAGAALTTARLGTWGATGTRPPTFMPPSMRGGRSLITAIDLSSAVTTDWSHANNSVVDSRNWLNRLFRWNVAVEPAAGGGFPWSTNTGPVHRAQINSSGGGAGVRWTWGFGQSFYMDTMLTTGMLTEAVRVVALLVPAVVSSLAAGSAVYLYVHANGSLRLNVTGTPAVRMIFWIDASPAYTNM